MSIPGPTALLGPNNGVYTRSPVVRRSHGDGFGPSPYGVGCRSIRSIDAVAAAAGHGQVLMGKLGATLRSKLFGIDPAEMSFRTRGFSRNDPFVVERLEAASAEIVAGHAAALEEPGPAALAERLDRTEPEHRGFAFEGAGMALSLLDRAMPLPRSRLQAFLNGPGEAHVYMVIIGAGWAWARLRTRVRGPLRELDPLLCWLAFDGFGFHESFFHTHRTIDEQVYPAQITGYARRAFDTGVGRALWFACCADPEEIAARISRFDDDRHAEIWAGVGLAASYTGARDEAALERLRELSSSHRGSLAQGAAFAAKARQRAGTPAEHTERAVRRLCRTSSEEASRLCDAEHAALATLDRDYRPEPRFETWRSSIRISFERSFEALERSAGQHAEGPRLAP